MNADTVIAKGQQYVEAVADGDIVLMHVESGRFFTLSGTGRRMWELMEQPTTIEALAERLIEEYAVDKDACIRDLLAVCEQLDAGKLIDVSG